MASTRSRLLAAAAVLAATALAGCGAGGSSRPAQRTSTPAHPRTVRVADYHRRRLVERTVRFAPTPLRGTSHTLTLPAGWHAALWAHVDGARLETWTPQHTLLVSSPGDGTVSELTPRPGQSPTTQTVVRGLTNPQGLAFDTIGSATYLYVAASNALVRYRWTDGRASDERVLVANLPDTQPAGDDVHRFKNVAVGADHTIFVDIGSSSNASIPAPLSKGELPRAAVIAFHPNGTLDRVWATGVRNGDGLAIAPDGTLWTAVNERDQITYPFHTGYAGQPGAYGQVIARYVDDHPPDEVARLTAGRNLGWPYCDPDPDVRRGVAGTAYDYGDMGFTPVEQTNPAGARLDCAGLEPVQRGLPAHSAPLGLSFLQGSALPARWADGAVVAGHGSWDRQPPRPPVVYWMPWDNRTRTLGPAITLVSGFQDASGNRWGRLADAVAGPDGSLYVTDDRSGAVYRITP